MSNRLLRGALLHRHQWVGGSGWHEGNVNRQQKICKNGCRAYKAWTEGEACPKRWKYNYFMFDKSEGEKK